MPRAHKVLALDERVSLHCRPPPPTATTLLGEHRRSKPSVLLAGNARAADRLIRAAETIAATNTDTPPSTDGLHP